MERAGATGVTVHVVFERSQHRDGAFETIRGSTWDSISVIWWIGYWQTIPYPQHTVM